MVSSIDEFRQRLYKELVLPSGLTAQIRKVQQWDLIGGEELPMPRGGAMPTGPGASDTENMQYLRRMGDRILARGTVRPALTDARDDGGEAVMLPDKLHVTELLQEDYGALLLAIRKWCGLTQEDGQAIEAFRQDSEREAGEGISGAVSLLAE